MSDPNPKKGKKADHDSSKEKRARQRKAHPNRTHIKNFLLQNDKYSISGFADFLKISPSSLSSWLVGTGDVDIQRYYCLCLYTGKTPKEMNIDAKLDLSKINAITNKTLFFSFSDWQRNKGKEEKYIENFNLRLPI